jgi:hypothetical protein
LFYDSGRWSARIVGQDVLFLIMWMTNIYSWTGIALSVLGAKVHNKGDIKNFRIATMERQTVD